MELKKIHTFFIIGLCTAILTSCYKEYDPDEPTSYVEYWCDPHSRNTALFPDQTSDPADDNTAQQQKMDCVNEFNTDEKPHRNTQKQ